MKYDYFMASLVVLGHSKQQWIPYYSASVQLHETAYNLMAGLPTLHYNGSEIFWVDGWGEKYFLPKQVFSPYNLRVSYKIDHIFFPSTFCICLHFSFFLFLIFLTLPALHDHLTFKVTETCSYKCAEPCNT